ncbi:hypothetical protein QBC34DRAFT_439237 [Podospora aff. communis PSN243]|uniref:Uncharacterized protein n=1 Tax=Podospora aff. communis PSN243 TaxID=3040156 RepID=A0AAV9GM20_9PEZI|nr:hypothetical protein QBC34DRAFT_439237 [Podospora aff. communis PSN243]
MALTGPEDRYYVYENRLASFQGAQPVTKRRASNASSRAPKALHWPHKSLSPVDLAKAGFFFEPFPGSPDNVVCFLCDKALDGWEEDDKPLEEHLRHSPTCGWAIMAAIEADLGDFGKVHPLDPAMIEARKETFGGKWPYESKKGFKCKTKQLAEAGWKYTPTLESDDMATCAYCHLALDGWESGDKPIDEHHKRSPDCAFFELISQYPPPKKASKAKAARISKASRLSIQSVATVATAVSDHHSIADMTADQDDSVMTTASAMTQGGKKATKGKKTAATKTRKTRAKKDEAVEVLEDAPEPVQEAPPKPTRGRKRASDAVEDSAATNAEAPPPKKARATRVRANTVDQAAAPAASQDTEMAEVAAPVKAPAKKKGRASTAKPRKVSQSSVRSQASTASLRANIDDDAEIDRQLQADLERPLTDDENVVADSDSEKRQPPAPPKGRTKKTAASKKNTQSQKEQQSEAFAMLDPSPVEPSEAEVEADLKALEAEVASQELPATEDLVVPKKGRKTGTRKASKQTKKVKEPAPSSDPIDELMEDVAPAPEPTRVPATVPAPNPAAVTKPKAAAEPSRQSDVGPIVEDAQDHDASTATVVNSTAGQPEKRGRGRPPKRKTGSQGIVAESEPRRSSGIPVKIEVQIESHRAGEPLPASHETPAKVARKPVSAQSPLSRPSPIPARSFAPSPATAASRGLTSIPRPARALPSLPPKSDDQPEAPATPPRANNAPSASAKQATLSPSQTPQSSDAENQAPSAKPATSAIPKRVVLAPVAATPMRGSPSKRNVVAGLQSTTPWTAVDLDMIFSPLEEKENGVAKLLRKGSELTSPEKRMTVEEWIYHNAGLAEQKLKHECETMVSAFENEGTRALRVLEGLVVD